MTIKWNRTHFITSATLIFTLGAGVTLPVRAETPDYKAGFSVLFELGLPDVSNQNWQYLPLRGASDEAPGSAENLLHETEDQGGDAIEALSKSLSNGWVEKAPQADAPPYRKLLIDGWQILAVTSDPSVRRQLQESGYAYSELLPTPDASPVNERADARALSRGVRELARKALDEKKPLLYHPDLIATYFFRAAQYHRRGYGEEAGETVQELVTIAGGRDQLLDLAVSKLANVQYQRALSTFRQTGSWTGLETDLSQCLKTFTRGWPERPLAAKHLELVRYRLSSLPHPPLLNGKDLAPEHQAWWKEIDLLAIHSPTPAATRLALLQTPPAVACGPAYPPASRPVDELSKVASHWLFGTLLSADETLVSLWRQGDASAPSWIQVVFDKHKNWDWISIMAAGVGDETLVPIVGGPSRYDLPDASITLDLRLDLEELSETDVDKKWECLERPLTRDELARSFLKAVLPPVVPGAYDTPLPEDPAQVREMAKSLSKAIRGKSPHEVARHYLTKGSDTQQLHAIESLLVGGDESDMEAVQNQILKQPIQRFDIAKRLVEIQRSSSKPFLERFRQALIAEQDIRRADTKGELPPFLKSAMAELEDLAAKPMGK